MWNDRIKLVTEKGLANIVGTNMERWFTKGFRERSTATIERMTEMFLQTPLEGYVGCCAAVRDMDHRELLAKIKAPTLVIAGREDAATPIENAIYIQNHVPGAALTVLDAAHISNVEQPAAYTDAVLGFLAQRR
jgi:3-oxoadipate enol-lactonase